MIFLGGPLNGQQVPNYVKNKSQHEVPIDVYDPGHKAFLIGIYKKVAFGTEQVFEFQELPETGKPLNN